jgi:hypothetical protein
LREARGALNPFKETFDARIEMLPGELGGASNGPEGEHEAIAYCRQEEFLGRPLVSRTVELLGWGREENGQVMGSQADACRGVAAPDRF